MDIRRDKCGHDPYAGSPAKASPNFFFEKEKRKGRSAERRGNKWSRSGWIMTSSCVSASSLHPVLIPSTEWPADSPVPPMSLRDHPELRQRKREKKRWKLRQRPWTVSSKHINPASRAHPLELDYPKRQDLIHLLLAPDAPEQLLPVAVAGQADARGRRSLALDARPPFPPLQVDLVDTHVLLQRLGLLVDVLVLLILFLLALVVAPRVIRPVTLDDADGHLDDHEEPHDHDDLQEQQHGQERPLDPLVVADEPGRVGEGLEQVAQAAGRRLHGALRLAGPAPEAARGQDFGRLRPYRVAHHAVARVARHEPAEHEDAEGDIAEGRVPCVLEALCNLLQALVRGEEGDW